MYIIWFNFFNCLDFTQRRTTTENMQRLFFKVLLHLYISFGLPGRTIEAVEYFWQNRCQHVVRQKWRRSGADGGTGTEWCCWCRENRHPNWDNWNNNNNTKHCHYWGHRDAHWNLCRNDKYQRNRFTAISRWDNRFSSNRFQRIEH